MSLPDATRVLRFSGPTALSVAGHPYPLPAPVFATGAEEDPSFQEQLHDLYGKTFVLCDILEQRFDLYYKFTELPAVKDLPHVNLMTMWSRVKCDAEYGPAELLRDAALMGQNLPITLSHLSRNRCSAKRWLRMFPRFMSSLTDEVKEFESCPDCVAHYYAFEDPFLIPCRRPHALVVVCKPASDQLLPAKALAIDPDTDRVRVGLFDATGTRMWLPRTACFLLCMRTWQHIWRRDWTKQRNRFDRAFAALFRHLLLLTARFGHWYMGPGTAGQIVSQATLFAPGSFFAPLTECSQWIDSLFMRPVVAKRTHSAVRQRIRIRCQRRGCGKRRKFGRECPLCEQKYCSSQCEQQDFAVHVFTCGMGKAVNDAGWNVSPETADLVTEALAQPLLLFGADDTLQFVDNGIEQVLQRQD